MTAATKKQESSFLDTVSVIVQALLLALVLRTFLFQPFNIPSGSMKPTLLEGDYIFVSKYSYGYSRHSFPLSPPLFDGRVWAGDGPERGDVVVFKFPPNPGLDYIKRVIGLPGDRIQMREGQLYINNEPVRREAAGSFRDEDEGRPVLAFRETLPNGRSYMTLDLGRSPVDNTRVFEVPPGHYFMMGDNRDGSDDSRQNVGFVPLENLVGKAQVIFMSVGDGASAWQVWRWPDVLRTERLFDGIE